MSRRLRWRLLLAASLTLGLSLFVWYPALAARFELPLPDALRARSLRLGLDLAGGVQMVLRVDVDEAIAARTQATAARLRSGLSEVLPGVAAESATEGSEAAARRVRIDFPEAGRIVIDAGTSMQRDIRPLLSDIADDFDVETTTERIVLRLRPAIRAQMHQDIVEQARQTVERRVDELGVIEPLIAVQGRNRNELLVQLPGVADVERARSILGTTARLEWKLVEAGPADTRDALPGMTPGGPPAGTEVVAQRGSGARGPFYLVRAAADITGSDLRTARPSTDEYGRPAVAFSLSTESGRRFATLTGTYVGRSFAILLDGEVESAPTIEGRIPNGEGRISGRFSRQEAADLALVLRSGALPASLTYAGGQFVGPSLGDASVRAGVVASLAGLGLVTMFMLFYYNRSGLNALVSIAVNLVLMLGLMALSGGAMTLPGIAGLILTIGMGVDSNVLVFERIKEELAAGRSVRQAVAAGFDRVFLTIMDTHVSSLIAAAFLFQFGTGPIRGFATTLTFGLLTNVFTAVFVSRTIFEFVLSKGGTPRFSTLASAIRPPRLDVYRWRWLALAASILVVAAGISATTARGGMPLGLDFSGGTSVLVRFASPVSDQEIRDTIPGDEVVQRYGNPADHVVSIRRPAASDGTQDDGSIEKTVQEVSAVLEAGDLPAFTVEGSESVGPAAGADLRRRAIMATAASLLGITAYIAFRFRPAFAVGAIAATVHDLLVTAAMLRIFGYDLSLNVVAAILTIAGYSVNDTIVTFDRARDEMRAHPGAPLRDIVNAAVNQTLGRTMITGGTTLLSVLALYLFDGDALEAFAFTMMVGIVSGTYSTIFVATSILLTLARASGRRVQRAA